MTMWLDQERFDTSKETLCTSLRWKQQFISGARLIRASLE